MALKTKTKWKISFPVLFFVLVINQVGLYGVNGYKSNSSDMFATNDDETLTIRTKRSLDYKLEAPQIIACPSAEDENQVYHRRVGMKTKISFFVTGSDELASCFDIFDHQGKPFKSSPDARIRVTVNRNKIDLEIGFVKKEDLARLRIVGKVHNFEIFLAFVIRPWGDYNPGSYITIEKEGIKTNLACPISDKFNQTIQWTKNGVNITPNKDYQFVNRELSIISPKFKDEGVYTCEVVDDNSKSCGSGRKSTILFEIERKTQLVGAGKTQNIKAYYEKSLQLICEGVGSNLTYVWEKQTRSGTWYTLGNDANHKINSKTGAILYYKIREIDDGKYACSVTDKTMKPHERIGPAFYLVRLMQEGPEITRFELVENSMECEVFGGPYPMDVFFTLNGRLFKPDPVSTYDLEEMIHTIKLDISDIDSKRLVGKLGCTAKNTWQRKDEKVFYTAYQNNILIQGYAPKIKITFSENVDRVRCSIDSQPIPDRYNMKRRGLELENVETFESDNFELILNLKNQSDMSMRYGTYTCFAQNMFGKASESISIWRTTPQPTNLSICPVIPPIYKPDISDLSVCFTGKTNTSRRMKRGATKLGQDCSTDKGDGSGPSNAGTSSSGNGPPAKIPKVEDEVIIDRAIVSEEMQQKFENMKWNNKKITLYTIRKGLAMACQSWRAAKNYEGTYKDSKGNPRSQRPMNADTELETRLLIVEKIDKPPRTHYHLTLDSFLKQYILKHVVEINDGVNGHHRVQVTEAELKEELGNKFLELKENGVLDELIKNCEGRFKQAKKKDGDEGMRYYNTRPYTHDAFINICVAQSAPHADIATVNNENLIQKVQKISEQKLSVFAQNEMITKYRLQFQSLLEVGGTQNSEEDQTVFYNSRMKLNEPKFIFRSITHFITGKQQHTGGEINDKIKELGGQDLSDADIRKFRNRWTRIWKTMRLMFEGEPEAELQRRCVPLANDRQFCYTKTEFIIMRARIYFNSIQKPHVHCKEPDCLYSTPRKDKLKGHKRRHELKKGVNKIGKLDLSYMSAIIIPRQDMLPQKGTASFDPEVNKKEGVTLYGQVGFQYKEELDYYTSYSDYSVVFIDGQLIKDLKMDPYELSPGDLKDLLAEAKSKDDKYKTSLLYYGTSRETNNVCRGMRKTRFKKKEEEGYYGFKISQETFHGNDPIKLKKDTFKKEANSLMPLFMRFNFFDHKEEFTLMNEGQESLPLFEPAKYSFSDFVADVTKAFNFAASGDPILVFGGESTLDDDANLRLPITVKEVTPLSDYYDSPVANCEKGDDEDEEDSDILSGEKDECERESESESSHENPIHNIRNPKLKFAKEGSNIYKGILEKFIDDMKNFIIKIGENLNYFFNVYFIIPQKLEEACPLGEDPKNLFKQFDCMKKFVQKNPDSKILVYIGTLARKSGDCVAITNEGTRYREFNEKGATMLKVFSNKYSGEGTKLKDSVDILEALVQFVFFEKDKKFVNPTPFKIANARQEHLPLFSYSGIFEGITPDKKKEGKDNFLDLWDFASEVNNLFEFEEEEEQDEDDEQWYDEKEKVDLNIREFFPIKIKKRMLKSVF